jgi:hypothetical protein
MLRWALERGVAHVLIADALADGVRTAARVASLNTSNIGDLARQLKLPPWKVKKAQSQARGWTIDALQQAIGVTAELNADVKGAAASADYALERAVRRIVEIRATSGNRPRGRGGVAAPGGSESGSPLGQRRLAVGGLVLVDDALAGGLVQRLAGGPQRGDRGLPVPGVGGRAETPDRRLQGGLDRHVALTRPLVRLDPLDLGLDVRHA